MLDSIALVLLLAAGWFVFQQRSETDDPSAFSTPPAELPAGPPGTVIRSQSLGPWPTAARRGASSTPPPRRTGHPSPSPASSPRPPVRHPTENGPSWPGRTGRPGSCLVARPRSRRTADCRGCPSWTSSSRQGPSWRSPTYPGLGTPGIHPYLVGESEGRAVLDSIRAARGLLGDQVGDQAAVYGHSQGGHAALFADQLAGTYAPDVPLAGVAAMAPPIDLADLLRLDSTEASGIVLTALALTSWSTSYPDAHLSAIVHPLAEPLVERIGHRCVATTDQGLSDLPDVGALAVQLLSGDPADAPGWGEHLRQNAPSAVAPAIPLLVSQGLTDSIVRPDITEAFVRAQCATGAPIELDTYAGTGHFAVRTSAAPKVASWLLDRLRGKPAPTGCATQQE